MPGGQWFIELTGVTLNKIFASAGEVNPPAIRVVHETAISSH